MKKTILTLALLASSSLIAKDLMMATTTSTDNTGLLDYLAPKFKKDTGINLKWIATGTGKALKMGSNCDVDILFVHAPNSEKKFVASGYGKNRVQVMYNDFVIVGSKEDKAQVLGENSNNALKKIRKHKANFFSRGDNSGTNKKEIALWKASIIKVPQKESWYIQTGQGMLRTLNMAEQKGGYTMTDRGTWIKFQSQKKTTNPLKIVVEGDKTLFNQYSVVSINKDKCSNVKPELAKAFSHWIVKEETQKFIGDFRLLGKSLFIPNAKTK